MAAEPRWRPNRVGRLHRSVAEQAHCSHGTLLRRSSSTTPIFNHTQTFFLHDYMPEMCNRRLKVRGHERPARGEGRLRRQ